MECLHALYRVPTNLKPKKEPEEAIEMQGEGKPWRPDVANENYPSTMEHIQNQTKTVAQNPENLQLHTGYDHHRFGQNTQHDVSSNLSETAEIASHSANTPSHIVYNPFSRGHLMAQLARSSHSKNINKK